MALSGCNKAEPENTDAIVSGKIPLVVEEPFDSEKEEVEISGINLNSEEGIKEYLIGEWISDKETLSDYLLTESEINCNMTINQDLNVNLSFYNRYTDEIIGDYMGQINLDSFEGKGDKLPDLISIDLGDSDWPGGDYFFLHRSIYEDRKSVV